MQSEEEEDFLTEDATEILPDKPYHWRDWSIVLDRWALYLWNGAAVLRLDKCSLRHFKFILDGKLSTMNVDGSYRSNSNESRRDILEKLQTILRNQVKSGPPSQPILSVPDFTDLEVGTWRLFSTSVGQIRVDSLFNDGVIELKEGLPGFVYKTNSGEKKSFIAKKSLGSIFAAGWARKKVKRFKVKSKSEDLTQKEEEFLRDDATEILHGKPYHWRDWNLFLDKTDLYLWNGAAVLKFYRYADGMFYFILNGMASILDPDWKDLSIVPNDNGSKYLGKLQVVLRNQVKTGPPSQPILTAPGGTRLVVWRWSLFCNKEGEIIIHNSRAPKQSITLKENFNGFIFVSNCGTKRLFTAETSLGPELAAGWAKKEEKCFNANSKLGSLKQKYDYQTALQSVSANPANDMSKQLSIGQPGMYQSSSGMQSSSQHHHQPPMTSPTPSQQPSPVVNPSQQLNRHVAIPEEDLSESAKEILPGKRYQWRNWSIVLDDIYLYLWNNVAVLDLCKESGGWFRFILDGEIAVMHSRGLTVKVPDVCQRETLEKLHAIHRNLVKSGAPIQHISTFPGATRFVVGNWSLFCNTEGEIKIRHCIYCKHAIILKEDVPGFIFESSIGKTSSFTDKVSINSVCAAGWVEKKEKNFNHKSKSETLIQKEEGLLLEDAKEIVPGKPYHWRDWSIVLDKDYFFLWSNAAILQLSKGDVGWFRFILDGEIALMYPDGTPGIELEECRREVQQKLQAVHQSQKETGPPSQPILSASGSTPLIVGPWSLFSKREGEIRIHNSSLSQEAIVLKEDLSGFIFETDVGGTTSFIANKSLVPEFAAGWAKKKERSSKPKLKLKDLKPKENFTKPKVGKCSYCKTTLNEDILLFHVKDCVHRPTNCPKCSATMLLKDIDNHCCDL